MRWWTADWIFVSGTTGYDYSTMTIAPDLESQTRQAFRNIVDGVGAGRREPRRCRARALLLGSIRRTSSRLAPIFGEYLGKARPAATAIVCGLVEPEMKIEIEVTARRRGAGVAARGARTGLILPGAARTSQRQPRILSERLSASASNVACTREHAKSNRVLLRLLLAVRLLRRDSHLCARSQARSHGGVAADLARCGVQGYGRRAFAEPAAQG